MAFILERRMRQVKRFIFEMCELMLPIVMAISILLGIAAFFTAIGLAATRIEADAKVKIAKTWTECLDGMLTKWLEERRK